MKNDFVPKSEPRPSLPAISAEEFDAMFDAGKDVSGYIDWDKGVMVAPGELSPGQKFSMQLIAEPDGSDAREYMVVKEQPSLNVSLPPWAFRQLQSEAAGQGITKEELAQTLIVQRLDKQKVSS